MESECQNSPMHSWPRVKILTRRHLCENPKWAMRRGVDAASVDVYGNTRLFASSVEGALESGCVLRD